jgi:4-amino-4-deoxy-L-arabinose transferase-like glycosyltransferase
MLEEPLIAAAQPVQAPARAFLDRHFRLCTAVLLVIMAAAQIVAALLDSQVVDEGYHLTAGYMFLRTGELNAETEHPPLAQALTALPLLTMPLRLPRPVTEGYSEGHREVDFLYRNTVPADRILLAARCGHICFTLLLGILIAWWTRKYFGPSASLAALALLAFEPNFLAHGHYATTDIPAALCFFAACLAWSAYLRSGGFWRAALSGAAVAVAMSTKYSAVFLFPIFFLLYVLAWWHRSGMPGPRPFQASFRHFTVSMAVVLLAMGPVLYVCFGFEAGPLFSPAHGRAPGLGWSQMPAAIQWAAATIPVPAPSMLHGIFILLRHNLGGHVSYLLGRYSETGWWYYFPVVMAVKTPAGILLAFALSIIAAAAAWRKRALRSLPIEWHVLIVPPLFYFAMALRSHIDIGIRHMLPLYPFVFVWIGAALFVPRALRSRRIAAAAALCLALTVVESAGAFPRYLAFFNFPSGGRAHGWKYVADSNLDWGQDLKRLQTYVAQHHIANVCLGDFPVTSPEYYGFAVKPLPASMDEARAQGCIVAASITHTVEWPLWQHDYAWVAREHPVDQVGDSFWIYDPAISR